MEMLYQLSYLSGKLEIFQIWSGRGESNPRIELGRLVFYH